MIKPISVSPFQSRLSLLAIFFTLLWMATDINQRFFDSRERNASAVESVDIQTLKLPIVTAEMLDNINTLYKKYQQGSTEMLAEGGAESKVMTAEQQGKQSGKQTTVFTGDNALQLRAIITTGKGNTFKQFALIEVTNVKTRIMNIEKFADETEVYGYQINIVNNTQIKLSNITTKEQQVILLTMYNS